MYVYMYVCPKFILGDGTSYDHEMWKECREWWSDGACNVIGHTEVKFKSCGQTLKWLWIAWIPRSTILTIFGTFSQNLIPKKCNCISVLTLNIEKKKKKTKKCSHTHLNFSKAWATVHGEWVIIAWQYSEVVGLIKYTMCKSIILDFHDKIVY